MGAGGTHALSQLQCGTTTQTKTTELEEEGDNNAIIDANDDDEVGDGDDGEEGEKGEAARRVLGP